MDLFPLPTPSTPACSYETTKAGDAVAALKKTLKPNATCKRNGKWETMDATLLVPVRRQQPAKRATPFAYLPHYFSARYHSFCRRRLVVGW